MTVTTENADMSSQNTNNHSGNATSMTRQHEEAISHDSYSIPGILHYIQHEWAKFELERSRWDVEKAELEAKIAFLQGERKGQENLKNDLVRRIKMLEHALHQERSKFHKLKYGTDLHDDTKYGIEDNALHLEDQIENDQLINTNSTISWKQGRQLLRQYLHEIGYTDTVIDVRSNRVRTLLGLKEFQEQNPLPMNIESSSIKSDNSNKNSSHAKAGLLAEDMLREAEQAVLSNFDFLNDGGVEIDDTDDEDDLSSEEINVKNEKSMDDDETDSSSMAMALKSLDLNYGNLNSVGSWESQQCGEELGKKSSSMNVNPIQFNLGEHGQVLENISLGELAQLTVTNEAESNYGTSNKESYSKMWNAKYTLRSHFDGIRSLVFHPIEPVLVTASEDHTMKLWNLMRTIPAKKSAFLDVEPIYTFRGHEGPVLCVGMNPTGEQCYSGGQDGTVKVWNLPNSNIDPYDSYDPAVLHQTLDGHMDAVWGLTFHTQKTQLLSCSADGTIKLWSPGSKTPLLQTYLGDGGLGHPTSVDFVREDCTQMVVSLTIGKLAIYDLETSTEVVMFESNQTRERNVFYDQVNCVVSHPTMPITIAAHEDRHIRFYDNVTGKVVHTMAAHQDAVTTLAVDPNGLYLLSGSHDCSIRLWNLENKQCVQEITSHRKKCDESIHCVAFHPNKPYIASAGADALAKVFV